MVSLPAVPVMMSAPVVSVQVRYSPISLQIKHLRAFSSAKNHDFPPSSYFKRQTFSLIRNFLCLFKDLAALPAYIDAFYSQSDIPTSYQSNLPSSKSTRFWPFGQLLLLLRLTLLATYCRG